MIYIYIYIHIYIYIYIHTPTCLPTYLHTYLPTYLPTYRNTCIHAYMHACMHAYIHTYIHTYIHISLPPPLQDSRTHALCRMRPDLGSRDGKRPERGRGGIFSLHPNLADDFKNTGSDRHAGTPWTPETLWVGCFTQTCSRRGCSEIPAQSIAFRWG